MLPTDSNQMTAQPQMAKAVPIAAKPVQAMPQATAVASPIVGPSVNASPLRNVNPSMRNMAPQVSSIAPMPANNGPMMRSPYGQQ